MAQTWQRLAEEQDRAANLRKAELGLRTFSPPKSQGMPVKWYLKGMARIFRLWVYGGCTRIEYPRAETGD
jgi:hypothetical protein